ncbi:MAG TPA: OmpA family protein [Thiobacillaceae bacterium]|nr:OmpA family protein [Thiobacillaceae bacterium]HNU63370.1 OmpA family protein [Thiobacillaceae bacterium]
MTRTVFPHTSLLPLLVTLSLAGCATRDFVQQEVAAVGTRISSLEGLVEQANQRLNATASRIQASEERIGRAELGHAALNRRLDDTQTTLTGAHYDLAELKVGMSSAHQRIETNAGYILASQRHLAMVEQQLDATRQRLDVTVTRLAQTDGRVSALEAELGQRLGRTDQRLDTASDGLHRVDGRLSAVEAEVRELVRVPPTGAAHAVMPETGSDFAPTSVPASEPVPVSGADTPAVSRPVSVPGASVSTALLQDPVPGQSGAEATGPSTQPPTNPVARTPSVADPSELQNRLDRVDVLIAEVHRRINVNTSSLQTSNMRIGELESGLAAAGRRGTASEAALQATREEISAVRDRLAELDQNIGANTRAMGQVNERVDTALADVRTANDRLGQAERQLVGLDDRLTRNDASDAITSATAREALERAQAAGRLAEGRLLAEVVLNESVGFALSRPNLDEPAQRTLLDFADRLKQDGKGVYIEIQGYTDTTGLANANLRLSRQRAESVRDFLHTSAGLPLHRMNVVAYGEAHPVADNKTREGRIKNRRVVLVVLK